MHFNARFLYRRKPYRPCTSSPPVVGGWGMLSHIRLRVGRSLQIDKTRQGERVRAMIGSDNPPSPQIWLALASSFGLFYFSPYRSMCVLSASLCIAKLVVDFWYPDPSRLSSRLQPLSFSLSHPSLSFSPSFLPSPCLLPGSSMPPFRPYKDGLRFRKNKSALNQRTEAKVVTVLSQDCTQWRRAEREKQRKREREEERLSSMGSCKQFTFLV